MERNFRHNVTYPRNYQHNQKGYYLNSEKKQMEIIILDPFNALL